MTMMSHRVRSTDLCHLLDVVLVLALCLHLLDLLALLVGLLAVAELLLAGPLDHARLDLEGLDAGIHLGIRSRLQGTKLTERQMGRIYD